MVATAMTPEVQRWRHATQKRFDVTPATRAFIEAVQELGRNLVGDLNEDDRTLLLRFAIAIMETPVRAGLLCWAAEVDAERAE